MKSFVFVKGILASLQASLKFFLVTYIFYFHDTCFLFHLPLQGTRLKITGTNLLTSIIPQINVTSNVLNNVIYPFRIILTVHI